MHQERLTIKPLGTCNNQLFFLSHHFIEIFYLNKNDNYHTHNYIFLIYYHQLTMTNKFMLYRYLS